MDRFNQPEDFALFLFLHLASVDGSLHPNERETILERMNELFPGHSFETRLEEQIALYQKTGSEAAGDLLKENWAQFASLDTTRKAKLFAVLFEIANSDARVHEEETRALKLIRSWINS